LHTLDQFLSATARLHPHVNVKAIVIGLMDRLSAYAAREAEALTAEQKQKNEEDAMQSLLERLQLAKDSPPPEEHQNGEPSDAASIAETETTAVGSVADSQAETLDGNRPGQGIPDDIKLFEIFNEQVQSLVKPQRLPLADAVALMVSLANLALCVPTFTIWWRQANHCIAISIRINSTTSIKFLPLQEKRSPNTSTALTYTPKPHNQVYFNFSSHPSSHTSPSSQLFRYLISSLYYTRNHIRHEEQ
jgi:hypothetical protein